MHASGRSFVDDPPPLPFATDFGTVSRRVPSALIGVGRTDGWGFHTPLGEQQFASEDGVDLGPRDGPGAGALGCQTNGDQLGVRLLLTEELAAWALVSLRFGELDCHEAAQGAAGTGAGPLRAEQHLHRFAVVEDPVGLLRLGQREAMRHGWERIDGAARPSWPGCARDP